MLKLMMFKSINIKNQLISDYQYYVNSRGINLTKSKYYFWNNLTSRTVNQFNLKTVEPKLHQVTTQNNFTNNCQQLSSFMQRIVRFFFD